MSSFGDSVVKRLFPFLEVEETDGIKIESRKDLEGSLRALREERSRFLGALQASTETPRSTLWERLLRS